LVARKELEDNEVDYIKKSSKYVRMATPSGIVDADKVISVSVSQLGEPISAYVMESSPTVMSIGRRCMTLGYSFVWNGYKNPYIVTPKGKKIKLEVVDYVPYLPISKSIPCAPSVVVAAGPEDDGDDGAGVQVENNYELINTEKRDLKAEALSVTHMLTHLPKNPHCLVCSRAKMENVKSRRKGGVEAYDCKVFGEHVTADAIVLHGLKDRGVGNKKSAIVFFDFGTGWISCHPVQSRSEEDTLAACQKFIGDKLK
jgi:hypothetical protein